MYEQMNLSKDIMQGQTFQSLELEDLYEGGVKDIQLKQWEVFVVQKVRICWLDQA